MRVVFAEDQHHRAILQQATDADAFQALEIFREQDWMSLSSLYQQVVRARESEDALIDIEGRLAWAEILADELQDIENAIECLKPVAVAPLTDTKALTVLKSLYQRNGDVTGEFEILEIELDVQAPGATRDILDQMDQLLNSVGDTRGELKERLLTLNWLPCLSLSRFAFNWQLGIETEVNMRNSTPHRSGLASGTIQRTLISATRTRAPSSV